LKLRLNVFNARPAPNEGLNAVLIHFGACHPTEHVKRLIIG
jgi:hypothetical protein